MDRTRWALLILLLLLALGLRLGWVLTRPPAQDSFTQLPDQREYLDIAQNALHGRGWSFVDPRFGQTVYAFRTPAYPAFLAACGAQPTTARIVQAVLDTFTVLAAYLLARRWFLPGPSLVAALLVAINPYLIYFTGLLLTETLFTAMLAWGIWLLSSRRTLLWLIGGAVLALSVLVRPGALALPIVMGIGAAFASGTKEHTSGGPEFRIQNSEFRISSPRFPLPVATTMLLLTILALPPWAIRNQRVLGQWIWTSTDAGFTAYDGFNPDATGASDQDFLNRMPQLRSMSETGRNEYLELGARAFIRQFPQRSLELAAAKIARTWSPAPLSEQFARPAYVAAGLAYMVPLDLLFLGGLLLGLVPRSVKLFLSAPAIYLTLAAAASVGSLRYLVPAEVPMAVVAAGAVEWIALSVAEAELDKS